jgi:hydroxypyruvate reductase
MADGAAAVLGDRIADGLIIAPSIATVPPPFRCVPGGHPLPTEDSDQAGRLALALASAVADGEPLLCLLSGGASAMMAAPAPGLTLADKIATTSRLLRSGAGIADLNAVRKHLSAVKGGQLARACAGHCLTLAISDVVGDDLAVIGSGPCVADTTTFDDALRVVERFGGASAFPPRVIDHIQRGRRGEVPETMKPDDEVARRAASRVIGSRRDAMDGASDEARRLGYHVLRIDAPIVGEARDAAVEYVREVAAQTRSMRGRFCVVSSGETTVRVTGHGTGGRNQEFALAAAAHLPEISDAVCLASVGTDGRDGPTIAAGAFADASTIARADQLGLHAEQSLRDNDSFALFDRLGDLVVTGPTGTNVSDLQVLVGFRS